MISVVCITNKNDVRIIKNIFNNYKRQIYQNKELIIIVNSNKSIDEYYKIADDMNIQNYNIYLLKPEITLGQCLNYSIYKMNGTFWAKMDDDDYYGEKYLTEAYFCLNKTKADIVGKKSVRVYDEDTKTLYDINQSKNKFV